MQLVNAKHGVCRDMHNNSLGAEGAAFLASALQQLAGLDFL
jgi:hypothetical protein